MNRRKLTIIFCLLVAVTAITLGVEQVGAFQTGLNADVDYAKPNYAYSPILRKFVDTLPGLGYANRNNLGQYIPVAVPDTTTYPGSDYYEISLNQYRARMHSDLPAAGTLLRGYAQVNATDPTVQNVNQYLGPLIIAKTFYPGATNGNGKPVRIKFINKLPIGVAGDLPLPVDTTIMGAGMGPIAGQMYTQNRSTIHLHGGNTPWISDGTPHQWITPAGDPTPYKKGVSFQNVPDMIGVGKSIPSPVAGDGLATYYYTNQQSGRLMFYHDHAYGITRLNVYAGVAAGYLLIDQVEEDMIAGTNVSGAFTTPQRVLPNLGGVYRYGIPLIIQDKTFVNDATTPPPAGFAGTATAATKTVDPLWTWSSGGNLWFPHVYMPNENIYDPSGFNPKGRWDYGPWMVPPLPAINATLPALSAVPEAYMDTPIVNGTAYPTVTLPATAIRFRVLNACNDRFLNLQLYYADPAQPTEVKMVPAFPNSAYPTWPKDGRDGGVPDPATAGPDIIRIGNEGGLLPQVAVIPAQPVDFDYSRRSATFGGVTSKSLMMITAERADIIVDFSTVDIARFAGADGKVRLILYNDAPAPMPLFDGRNDNFTGAPDQTAIGGPPSTQPGYGPNTRTIMQIVIDPTLPVPSRTTFNLAALQSALPKAYKASQEPPLVPNSAYDAAFGTTSPDVYANTVAETLSLTGSPQPVASIVTTLPGIGYTTPPAVVFTGGGGTGAAAIAKLNGVTAVTVTVGGTGYTTAPKVTFTGGGGTGATAVATVSGGVLTTINISNPGSGYLLPPTVTIAGGGGTGARAVAAVTPGSVGTITLTNGGSGYTSAPMVYLVGNGAGAGAAAMLKGDTVIGGVAITEGFDIWYGRMNAVLGTIPNPLDPTAPAPPVPGISAYIDPPTDFVKPGRTDLWRVSHIGVDSHAIHFHLFNVQVVNRVDWTNTILPPDPDELGWKETVRTNPFTDLIVALRPKMMVLPFQIPNSVRLLDPTTPAGSTANFAPVPPLPGAPASALLRNRMTDFGWEYVWHCHLLGHEENDMMRPLVFQVSVPAVPTGLTATVSAPTPTTTAVALAWVSSDPGVTRVTIQRATNATFTTGLMTTNLSGNPPTTTYTDTGITSGVRYYYRVRAFNPAGVSGWSATATVIALAPPLNLTSGAVTRTSVVLNWTDQASGENGYVIQLARNATFTSGLSTTTVNTPNLATYTRTGLSANTLYYFRVAPKNAVGTGPWSNVISARTLP